LVDELECVLSVSLAIVIAHLVGAQNISWAAISAYMVMRSHVSDSLLRGTLRILGTAFGAGLALLVVPAVQGSWPLSSVAGSVFGGVTLYGGLTGRRAYAWLFTGLTFEMILLDKLEHPNYAITAFAATRLMEVASGTCACIVVSTLSTLTGRRRWPACALRCRSGSVGIRKHFATLPRERSPSRSCRCSGWNLRLENSRRARSASWLQ
jgi:uncharacterized membrane protein YccC